MPPQEKHVQANGLDFAVYDWGGEQQPMLFAHATGFHARCWDAVIEPLQADFHAFSYDMRGHGRSEKPTPPNNYHWHDFGHDLAEIAEMLGFQGGIGVGHSVGAHSTALAAALKPHLFSKIILIDPVIMPKAFYENPPPLADHFSAKRRNEWASPDEMFARFQPRPPFDAWQPRVLRDYCEYGLIPNPNGEGFILACPPAIEASIYQQSPLGDIYPQLPNVNIPTLIIRLGERASEGTWDMLGSPTSPDLVSYFAQGEDLVLENYNHFAPMQDPSRIAEIVRAFASKQVN